MSNAFQGVPSTGLPRMIIKGQASTLELAWFVDNVLQTATVLGGTFTLKQGATVLLDEVAVSSFGGPGNSATYDLTAPDTSSLSYSDDMLEIWTLTTAGEPVTVRRSGHLVRTILYPMITDSDLIARHRRLDDMLPPGITTWASYRDLAWSILNRDLIKRGRRPELVLDSFALIDAHVYKSLAVIFRDLTTLVGDGRYTELSTLYAEAYVDEWANIQFRYDRSESDDLTDSETMSAAPSVWFGVPPGHPSIIRGSGS